ncbi:ribosome recycling factor [Trichuris trichiura]|uniref:Ribosome-recycling factor, mitochondrial n=1 Tax=Trichuris trichiura TaxID=36087 RepID=A0A077YXC8_TRITR|nr:ribosome recycling factor [Trichuris trichiura]
MMWLCNRGAVLRHVWEPWTKVTTSLCVCSLKLAIDKGGKKRKMVKLDEKEIQQYLDITSMNAEMEAELAKLKRQYSQQLSMQNVLGAFETLEVKPPGSKEPVLLNSIAQITLKNPRMAVINFASSPEAVKAITQAIDRSGMDVGYQQQNNVLYVPLPRPSREKRENMARNAKLLCNQCHDRLRAVMRSYEIKMRSKKKELSQDVYASLQQHLEETMRSYARKGEVLMESKQSELLDQAK